MAVKTFDDADVRSHAARALQIWQILIGAAYNRQILTYKILQGILGFDGPGVFAQPLGHIMYFCIQHKLPPLTALVVTEKTGQPGIGLKGRNLNAQRESIFDYEWFKVYPPTEAELSRAYKSKGKP